MVPSKSVPTRNIDSSPREEALRLFGENSKLGGTASKPRALTTTYIHKRRVLGFCNETEDVANGWKSDVSARSFLSCSLPKSVRLRQDMAGALAFCATVVAGIVVRFPAVFADMRGILLDA